MPNKKIVLDTNCLLASISRRSTAYPVWKGFQEGRYTLCVTIEILAEYEEMIAHMASAEVATIVIRMIMDSRHVEFIDTYYHWNLITADPDDNKFVDCAFATGATYIVSDDSHFSVLRDITFPQLLVLRLKEFLETLQRGEE
mgnify:FL=1